MSEIRLIDANALKKKLTPIKLYEGVYCKVITEKDIDYAPTVKSFTRSELEGWLFEIYNNNRDGSYIDCVFAEHVKEIFNRLDGFEKYVEDERREAST